MFHDLVYFTHINIKNCFRNKVDSIMTVMLKRQINFIMLNLFQQEFPPQGRSSNAHANTIHCFHVSLWFQVNKCVCVLTDTLPFRSRRRAWRMTWRWWTSQTRPVTSWLTTAGWWETTLLGTLLSQVHTFYFTLIYSCPLCRLALRQQQNNLHFWWSSALSPLCPSSGDVGASSVVLKYNSSNVCFYLEQLTISAFS